MSCIELEADLSHLTSGRETEAVWLQICRYREAEAKRDAEIAEQQLLAIDLQIVRLEDALERCRAYGGRR